MRNLFIILLLVGAICTLRIYGNPVPEIDSKFEASQLLAKRNDFNKPTDSSTISAFQMFEYKQKLRKRSDENDFTLIEESINLSTDSCLSKFKRETKVQYIALEFLNSTILDDIASDRVTFSKMGEILHDSKEGDLT
ncbi:hypothetical protein BB560_003814, partial [Smittium megazygosporum]